MAGGRPPLIILEVKALYASARRIAILCGGSILLVAGIVLLVLPGPGVPLIIAGLALLGTQFAWARRASSWLRDRFRAVMGSVRSWVRPRTLRP